MTRTLYIETITRLQSLNHQLLDQIKDEFKRIGWNEVNPAQALMLFHIGAGNEIAAGDVRARGYYFGSNASYNLMKLRDGNYIERRSYPADRRVVKIALTPKGEEVAEVVDDLIKRHLRAVGEVNSDLTSEHLKTLNNELEHLERVWTLRSLLDLSHERTAA